MQIDTFYTYPHVRLCPAGYTLMHGKEKIYCVTTNIINIQTKQLAFLSVDCSLKVMTRYTR